MASASYNHTGIDVEECDWLGIIAPTDIRSDNSAMITPLAYVDDVEGGWHTLQPGEQNRYFPNNGKVYVLAKDYFLEQIGRLSVFQVQLNPRAADDDNPRHSRYMTYGELEEAPLVQILNWTTQAEHLFELPDLLDQGIGTGECFSQRIYIRYGSLVYGPVQLEPMLDGSNTLKPREYIRAVDTGGPQLLLRVYRVSEDEELLLGRGHFINEHAFESPLGKSDWSRPQVVIKRVLRASKLPDELEQDEQLVDRRVSALARLSSQHGPAAFQLEETTLERAQYILGHQTARLENVERLLAALTPDHPLLLAARTQEIALRKAEIDQEIHSQLQIQQERLQNLQNDVQHAESRLAEINQTIQQEEETAWSKQGSVMGQASSSVSREVSPSHETDPQRLVQLNLSDSAKDLGDGREIPGWQAQLARGRAFTPTRFFLKEGQQSDEDLPQLKWIKAAEQDEVRSKEVKLCAAALLAGLIPATSGPAAFAALRSVARLLAGDRICRTAIPLTALTPLDLFGSLLLEQGRFLPRSSLPDILLEARNHPDALALVVLEGIDRVPAQPVVVPILQHYREVRCATQQTGRKIRHIMPLELFHPTALSDDDPYQNLASFTWPENVLLAATCDNDTSSLPLPAMCLSWLVRTEPALQERTLTEMPGGCWQVRAGRWYAWEQESARSLASLRSESLPETLEQRQRIFYAVLQALGLQNAELLVEQTWPQQFAR